MMKALALRRCTTGAGRRRRITRLSRSISRERRLKFGCAKSTSNVSKRRYRVTDFKRVQRVETTRINNEK